MLGLLLIAGLCISRVLPHPRQGDNVHVALHHWGFDSMHQAASISRQPIRLRQTLSVGAPLLAGLAPGLDGLVGSELACEAPAAIQVLRLSGRLLQQAEGAALLLHLLCFQVMPSALLAKHSSVRGTGMMLLASSFA